MRLVSLFLKNSAEKDERLDHEFCKRSFYDKSFCILYTHDLTKWSSFEGFKDKLKLYV